MRAAVGLGDVLRAWHALKRDPALLPMLARTFGLGVDTRARPEAGGQAVEPQLEKRKRERRKPLPPTPSETFASQGLVTSLEPLPPVTAPTPPSWLAAPVLSEPTIEVIPPPPPLFAPGRERALLAAICRTLRPEGDIDVARVVDGMSRLQLPRALPRLQIPSLTAGLQVVIDQSPWMAPYRADLARLVLRLRDVAGDLMECFIVGELPPAIRARHEEVERPWTPPKRGTAIVLVTDLGRAALRDKKRGPRRAWVATVGRMREAGFAPLVIVPGRPASYVDVDRELRHTLLLGWDRRTRIVEASRFRKERTR